MKIPVICLSQKSDVCSYKLINKTCKKYLHVSFIHNCDNNVVTIHYNTVDTTKSMLQSIIVVVLILLEQSWQFEQEFETLTRCKKLTKCDCLQPTDTSLPIEIHCPNFADDQMQLYYRINVSLLVQCLPPLNWDIYNENYMLEELRQNGNIAQLKAVIINQVEDVKVSHCNLSNSFEDLRELLASTKPRYLSLRSNIVKNFSLLSQNHMALFDSIDTLNLENNNIVDIPYHLFQQIRNLKHVSLNFNKIQNVNQPFDENVESLQIAQNSINYISKDAFRDLIFLDNLHLWGNNITHVEYYHFQRLFTLRLLELSRNYIKELHVNVFSNLIQLRSLNLESNLLKRLPESLLNNNKNLESVRFSRNKHLGSLPSDLFSNLPNLRNVRVNSCSLIKVSQSLFANSFEIEIIYLNDNLLNELPVGLFKGLRRLKILNLSNNQMTTIPLELFHDLTSLTKLDISGNALQRMSNNLKIVPKVMELFQNEYNNVTTRLSY